MKAGRHSSLRAARRGVTLVELLVVIVLLGIIAGVSVLGFARASTPARDDKRDRVLGPLAAARRNALRMGRPVTITIDDSSAVLSATALPDGSVVADAGIQRLVAWDRLSGVARTEGKDHQRDEATSDAVR